MRVILSIKPEFVEKIRIGEKKYEYRRKIFKRQVRVILVYATSPVKAIVGEIIIGTIIHSDLNNLWKKTKASSGISEKFFYKYFVNLSTGYAIKIHKFILYESKKQLIDFGIHFPPQSYIYID